MSGDFKDFKELQAALQAALKTPGGLDSFISKLPTITVGGVELSARNVEVVSVEPLDLTAETGGKLQSFGAIGEELTSADQLKGIHSLVLDYGDDVRAKIELLASGDANISCFAGDYVGYQEKAVAVSDGVINTLKAGLAHDGMLQKTMDAYNAFEYEEMLEEEAYVAPKGVYLASEDARNPETRILPVNEGKTVV